MSTLLETTTNVNSGVAWVDTLVKAVFNVISPVLVIAAVAGIFYAIWIGVKFVKAEDKSARDEAKQKLIYVIVGIVVTVALIILFIFLANNVGENGLIDPTKWGNNIN